MTFTYNFDDNFEFLDEKSDPLTSIGEFDLISSQNLEQSLQTDWIEVERTDFIPNSFIEHNRPLRDYSKLDVVSSLNLFFTDNFYTLAFKYTNNNINRKNVTRKRQIKYVKKDEIKKYIAILLFLGVVPIKNVKLLWNKNSKYTYNENIANIMNHTRFKEINAVFDFLSTNDYENNKVSNEPKIIQYLNMKFTQHMNAEKNISIDESILAFKGNIKNPSNNPLKAHKRGMKFYCLNNSETGYCLKLLICSHKSSLENTIMSLLRDHFDHWHVLYVDNFYNSVEIAENCMKKRYISWELFDITEADQKILKI